MKRYILTLILTPFLLLSACTPAEQDNVEAEADSLAAATDEEIREFRTEIDSSLADIDMKLDSLEVWAEEAGDDAAAEMDSTLATLREQRDAVQQDLQQLGTATQEGFQDARTGIETELDELENNVEDAWARYGEDEDGMDAS